MIDWQHIQQHWDWLGHIVEAVGIAAVTALLFRLLAERRVAVLMGISFAVGHFHGREKRDHEISLSMPSPHLDAYLMWRWSWDQATDFWPVALVGLVAVAWLSRNARQKSS